MVALAVLMPIVAGDRRQCRAPRPWRCRCGRSRINQLTRSNTWRTISREISVALLNGVTIAVLLGVGVALVFANPQLGAVIAAAMLINIVVAGLSGVLVPLVLERAGQDPAVASSVFVTMITDSMGFFVFLGLAVGSGLVG